MTRRVRPTPRDLALIRWLARMRYAHAAQVGRFAGMSPGVAHHRCHALTCAGLLRYERALYDRPGVFTPTAAGCTAARSPLPALRPPIELAGLAHDLAVVSLSLDLLAAAPPGTQWLSNRELRRGRPGRRGVGNPATPDGALLLPDGRRVAVELDLDARGTRRLARVCLHHARFPDFGAARYFVPTSAAVARLARTAAGCTWITLEVWRP